jgi:hypothetical protein
VTCDDPVFITQELVNLCAGGTIKGEVQVMGGHQTVVKKREKMLQ